MRKEKERRTKNEKRRTSTFQNIENVCTTKTYFDECLSIAAHFSSSNGLREACCVAALLPSTTTPRVCFDDITFIIRRVFRTFLAQRLDASLPVRLTESERASERERGREEERERGNI